MIGLQEHGPGVRIIWDEILPLLCICCVMLGEPLSPVLPVPFEVTLGVIYRQEGGVEWSWGLLLSLSPNPH